MMPDADGTSPTCVPAAMESAASELSSSEPYPPPTPPNGFPPSPFPPPLPPLEGVPGEAADAALNMRV